MYLDSLNSFSEIIMGGSQYTKKRCTENTEAWIVGSGTASLASALYLIKQAKVQPSRVHILDKHASLGERPYNQGDPSSGYDQFAGCLPVPVDSLIKELLAMTPSIEMPGRSLLDEIETAKATRLSAKGSDRTCFLAQTGGSMEHLPVGSLDLGYKLRATLTLFLLKREKYLMARQIRDIFPDSFFKSAFWIVWSTQYVFGLPLS